MRAFGCQCRVGGSAALVYLLVLSGTWKSCVSAATDRRLTELQLNREDPDRMRPPIDEVKGQGEKSGRSGHVIGHRSTNQLLQSPDDRLSFCNESTVAKLSADHFDMIENGLHEYRCWSPRIGRLMALLRDEQRRGDDFGKGAYGRGISANEGHRLRCRILFKFDTCRSNFAKYYQPDNPEISTEWPEEILEAINSAP